MRRLLGLLILTVFMLSAADAAPPVQSPATQRDVTCFLLFAYATDKAHEANDDAKLHALAMGLTFYAGKLAVEAPGLDLHQAILQQLAAMQNNPKAKEIGDSCDEEFGKAGKDLQSLGQQLQKEGADSAPSK